MSSELLNFESITNDKRSVLYSDLECDILSIFENVMNSPDLDNDQKANHFVNELVALEKKASLASFVQDTWHVIFSAASCVPCRHHGHDVLLKAFRLLDHAGEPWKDYPDIGIALREEWNRSPVFDFNTIDDPEQFNFEEWLNFNSFVARLGRGFTSLGLWELRFGLETSDTEQASLPNYEAIVNTRILVALEWILQAGCELLRSSLQNSLSEMPSRPGAGDPWRTGVLFDGARGFNLGRWGFWKRRLGVIKGRDVEMQQRIDKAVQVMTRLESEMAAVLDARVE